MSRSKKYSQLIGCIWNGFYHEMVCAWLESKTHKEVNTNKMLAKLTLMIVSVGRVIINGSAKHCTIEVSAESTITQTNKQTELINAQTNWAFRNTLKWCKSK